MKKTRDIVLKAANAPWFYPLALLLIGIVAYGLMLPHMGFYWDDWESVYLYYLHDPSVSFQYFAWRPFSVLTYLALFPITPMISPCWQLISLILRWSGIVFLYWTLNAIWPERVWLNRWVGILIFVFPGFIQQPVSLTYSRHFTSFALFTCSLFLTVLALKKRRFFWLWMPLSVLLGFAQLFIVEYFVTLEIIRPFVIWFIVRSERKEKWRYTLWKTLLYWSPFVVGLVAFFGWRFLYLPTLFTTDPNSPSLLKGLINSPLDSVRTLLEMAYQDLGYLVIGVWSNAFSTNIINIQSKTTWFSWLLGFTVAIPFGYYVGKAFHEEKTTEQHDFIQRIILSIVALVAGVIPVWSTNRYVFDGKWSDRFTLAPMLGAVMLAVWVLDWLIRTRGQKQCLLIILLASSVSYQIYNVNKFRLDWENQRNLYWQLSWRIPNLETGTAIIGSGTFTDKSSLYDGSYIVNLLFDDEITTKADYGYFDIWHLSSDNYHPGVSISDKIRGGLFSGSTSQAIGMYFNADTTECVRILDPVYSGDSRFNEGISKLISISDPSLITAKNGSGSPDPAIFGTEPAHTWCYYFEKADLARQMQDWSTVLQLGAEAEAKGLDSPWGSEYLPFIEAYAQTGQWAQAYELSLIAQSNTADLEPLLCSNWKRFAEISIGTDRDAYLAEAESEFCVAKAK